MKTHLLEYIKMKKSIFFFLLFSSFTLLTFAQNNLKWKGKRCAVILTYDDGMNVHLKNAIPALDSLGLKGTFYLCNNLGILSNNIDNWREAAANGHELGNHTIYHPCEGGRPGREFVTAEYDLNNYTVRRIKDEIRTMNTLLKAIDGRSERTFAFTCGDMKIKDTAYFDSMKNLFVAARGVTPVIQSLEKVNLYDVGCYPIVGQSGDEMIKLVKQAQDTGGILVFLFHGVGGGHSMNVTLSAHSQLLHYLKQQENNIWIAPMLEITKFIKEQQQNNHQ